VFEDGVVIRLDLADLGVDGSVLVTRCGPCIGTLRIIVPWVELYASKGIDQAWRASSTASWPRTSSAREVPFMWMVGRIMTFIFEMHPLFRRRGPVVDQ
jgi:hypothetical protein